MNPSKNHYCTWERRAVLATSEFQSASHKSIFAFHTIIVPPCRVRSCRKQTYHSRPPLCGFICFTHPIYNISAVWRIHPTHPAPLLLETVLFRSEEASAFSIFWKRAYICFKLKFCVETVKKILRRFPQISIAGKHSRVNHFFVPPGPRH